jgi:predicted anti-sigma-YlaC factor YlaD
VKDVVRTQVCERARTWVSLSLDGELSELERRLLDAHVARCSACGAFAAELEGVVAGLRSTPLTAIPSGATSSAWRRRSIAPVRVAGRAAAVAAAAAAGLAMFSLGAESVSPVAPERAARPIIIDATSMSDTMQEIAQLRDARRAQLLSVETAGEEHSGTQPL